MEAAVDAVRSLGALLAGHAPVPPDVDRAVRTLAGDSRSVTPGALFFARAGARTSGERFVEDAVRAGAVAIVREGARAAHVRADGVAVVEVADVAACMGAAADRFHRAPSRRVRVIGITGTNGKTSVSHFVARATATASGVPGAGAVIGTLGWGAPGRLEPADLTTPDVLRVHARLDALAARGHASVAMEVSSHALAQGRVAGVRFAAAALTNLTRDHLDYHADMGAYALAKARLFDAPGLGAAVVNVDDPFGRETAARIAARIPVIGYGMTSADAAVAGRLLEAGAGGLRLAVRTPGGEAEIAAPLLGRFNAYNLLAALGVLLAEGLALDVAAAALGTVCAPPGRMQRFGGGARPLVVVDYSHTPDSLAAALAALREHCPGVLWCVFGCGGERDRGKRPAMARAAEALADAVVVTDDNPRGEDGDRIVADVLAGFAERARVEVERDRGVAIARAIAAARAGDVVLVAGKGHEAYQERDGVRHPFSDAAEVRAALGVRA